MSNALKRKEMMNDALSFHDNLVTEQKANLERLSRALWVIKNHESHICEYDSNGNPLLGITRAMMRDAYSFIKIYNDCTDADIRKDFKRWYQFAVATCQQYGPEGRR